MMVLININDGYNGYIKKILLVVDIDCVGVFGDVKKLRIIYRYWFLIVVFVLGS